MGLTSTRCKDHLSGAQRKKGRQISPEGPPYTCIADRYDRSKTYRATQAKERPKRSLNDPLIGWDATPMDLELAVFLTPPAVLEATGPYDPAIHGHREVDFADYVAGGRGMPIRQTCQWHPDPWRPDASALAI